MEQKFTKFIANFYLCSIRKNPPKNGAKIHQIYCKHKTFFTWVYMIFKYSKRFRFAPSFNNIWMVHYVVKEGGGGHLFFSMPVEQDW